MNSLLQTRQEQKPLACIFIAQEESMHEQRALSKASWLPLIQAKFKTILINTPRIETIPKQIATLKTDGCKISLAIIMGHGDSESIFFNHTSQSKLSTQTPAIEEIFPADRIEGSLILLSCETGRNLAPLISKKCPHLTVTAPVEQLNALYAVSYPCDVHKTCHFNFYNRENNNITYTSNPCATKPDFRFFKQSIEEHIQQQNIFTASQIACLLSSGFTPEKQEILKPDPEKAELIAMHAARHNRADAQTFVGNLYFNQKKYTEAESWLLAAAKKDHTDAQAYLGHLYLQQNKDKKAEYWLLAAAKKDHTDAQACLGAFYLQQSKDKKAETWLLVAAKRDHKDAQTFLGALYFKQGNDKAAEYWLLAAAKKGCEEAQTNLGYLYLQQKKDKRAETWLLAAAQKDRDDAQAYLGALYLQQGKDQEAEHWLLAASQKDRDDAQANLGYLYLQQGKDKEAEDWLLVAAQKGIANAQAYLGALYFQQGKDQEAETWLSAASQQHHEAARLNLEQLHSEAESGKKGVIAVITGNAETANKADCM